MNDSSKVSFQHLEPLLAGSESAQIIRGTMRCTFTCPATQKEVAAQASLDAANRDAANRDATTSRIKAKVQSGIARSVSRGAMRFVASLFGNNEIGRMAREVTGEAVTSVASKRHYSETERQNAIVAAFRSVSSQFFWNDEANAWQHESAKPKPDTAQDAGVSVAAALILAFSLVAPGSAQDAAAQNGEQVVITVGGDKEAGKALGKALGKWAKSPTKGFKRAAKAIAEKGARTVVIKIAAGKYKGDLGSGVYQMPRFQNPEAKLRIEGGYSADFTARDPFRTPTHFACDKDRSAPLIKFWLSRPHAKMQDELEALVIDGLFLDVTKSNRYDSKNNMLLTGSSCTQVVVHFGYLKTNLLEVKNNIVLNSPHRAFETIIRAKSKDAEIRVANNYFINCVIPVKLDSARGPMMPKRIVFDHNSVLLNWAYNPDPNTSNPCAIELGPQYACKEMHITNNLFYANFGGAILALHKKLPELYVNGNNFVGNGMLHGQSAADAVAMIAEAGGRKQPLDVATIEDLDAVEEAEGNVSIAPGIPMALDKVQVVDASTVKVEDNWENQARSILGLNLRGGKVDVGNYAPKKEYDAKQPPLPQVDTAKRYGVQIPGAGQ